MRKFECPFGEIVDLDDPTTYDYLPKDKISLDEKMFCEIGKALTYMNYFHPDIFPKRKNKNDLTICGWQQRQRVNQLIKNFADKNHYDDVLWYQEQIFLFQEEIENMC